MSPPSPVPDPRALLASAPMSRRQWIGVVVTLALSAMDGFDVLSVTLAAPALMRDWALDPAALGVVLSAGLVGMAAGSLVLAPLADLIGRRRMVFAALALTGAGMALSGFANGVLSLSACRVLTGLGVGAMVSVINPLATEFANARRRELAIALMAVGYPIGGVVGGVAASLLLQSHGWPALFWLGGLLSLLLAPIVWLWLPEPLSFLIERPDERSLERANRLLASFGHGPVAALPPPASRAGVAGLADIFGRDMLGTTLGVTLVNLCYAMAVYYALSWMPQLVAQRGFAPAQAASVSLLASLAGVVGGATFGWVAPLLGLKRLAGVVFCATGLLTILFSVVPADLAALRGAGAALGVFLFAGAVAVHAIVSRSFDDRVRATGVGFVIGIGRIGSALAPLIAGLLFAAGFGPFGVSGAMGGLAIAAALILSRVRMRVPESVSR
jgi:benzoate transport